MVSFLDLHSLNLRHRAAYQAALVRVLQSGRFLLGDELAAFEREFAAYCGTAHCVGVGSGLDALTLVLRAWDIGVGDEVLVPSHTFIATWLAVSQVGATPVPVDVDPLTCNLDPAHLQGAITPRTRAVIPVHLYGRPANMHTLRSVAHCHGLKLLEDAAQAHGARHRGRSCGSLGDAAAFSFYPGKNLGALGDGGAITTDDGELAERLRLLRNYGSRTKYVHELAGSNTRLDELQAAFLRERLRSLDDDNERRCAIARAYRHGLRDAAGLVLPPDVEAQDACVWHLFVVQHARRDRLAVELARRGVQTLVHYPTPPHRQLAYLEHASRPLPVAERLAAEVLSLPIGPTLADCEVEQVIEAMLSATCELFR